MIADVSLGIFSQKKEEWASFYTFEISGGIIDSTLSIVYDNESIEIPADTIFDHNIGWLTTDINNHDVCVYKLAENGIGVRCMLKASAEWKTASIHISKNISLEFDKTLPLSDVLFRNRILFHHGLVLHSSAIKYRDQAIVFTAPSGTGKTTMAHLWKQHKDVVILNGDSPAMRMMGGRPIVFGTPWSGSKPEFVNDSAPLKAIVVLEQAPENKIRKLDAYEYVTRVLPRVYLPYFDEILMSRALKNFEMIVGSGSVYLLQCRPDQEAVELVHQCLF